VLQPSAQLLDPHVWTDAPDRLNIRFSIYEPLVEYDDERARYNPALAQGWSVEADARTWTLDVRPDVVFHNGDQLGAADVVATLDRARDPAMGGELGTQGLFQRYLGGASITATDSHRVEITTPEPMADLLDLLVEIPILPGEVLTEPIDCPVGSGPYRLVDVSSNCVVVDAFDGYWRRRPMVDRIRWVAQPAAPRRVAAVLAGEADVATSLPPEDAAAIASADGVRLVTSESSVCAVFMCNLFSGVCTDRRVRQALNYALNTDEMIRRVMFGAGRRLNGPLTPHHLGYDPSTPQYEYEPEKAERLLKEAGLSSGLHLILDVPTVTPDRAPELAARMAEQYARIGIDTEVREFEDRPAYAEMVRSKEIDDACCFDSSPLSTYRVLREKFHSGHHGPWWMGYENAHVNELLDRAAETSSLGARQELYQEAYGLIRDDAPWIFLFSPRRLWAVRETIGHLRTRADGVIRFK
jgi:peptide/nickel transport system substrate-binding protein